MLNPNLAVFFVQLCCSSHEPSTVKSEKNEDSLLSKMRSKKAIIENKSTIILRKFALFL